MLKKTLGATIFMFIAGLAFGQTIDSLKLNDNEIPTGYSKSNQLLCASTYASSFYEQTDLYETILGKIVKKEFQSFDKKGDKGSILYFEFEKEFNGGSFLNGLLWGQNSKPTKSASDEYYSKGKILIIWSFNLKSELKQISKTKVVKLFNENK
jgi:hypothetical protein